MLRVMTVAALILGAGAGERFQASAQDGARAPVKALAPLAGRSLLAHALHTLAAVTEVAHLLPVLPAAVVTALASSPSGLTSASPPPSAQLSPSPPSSSASPSSPPSSPASPSRSSPLAASPSSSSPPLASSSPSRSPSPSPPTPLNWDACDWPPHCAPVAGGETRRASVAAGLRALPGDVDFVLVHDAARPLLRAEDAARVLAVAREHGAALLAAPVRDALHRTRAGVIAETLVRNDCWAAQTPQVFRRAWLEAAHAHAPTAPCDDDAELVARLGHPVRVVPGRADNFKITTCADLARAERLLRAGVL